MSWVRIDGVKKNVTLYLVFHRLFVFFSTSPSRNYKINAKIFNETKNKEGETK